MKAAALTGEARLQAAFERARSERRLALAVYLTVGYPDRGATRELALAAVEGGADVIELGVPFSDPLADGTTVQRASEAALRNGVTFADCLAEGRALAERGVPVILMGYTNSFLQRGYPRLAADLATGGVAGAIIVDMPAEESAEVDAAFAPHGLARIDLYAPTTPDERLARLAPSSRGFIYCVALTGVTGARRELGSDAPDLVRRVKKHAKVPVVVGFGISTPDHVRALRGVADGVAIGSAVLDTITRAQADQRAAALRDFVASLSQGAR